MILSFINIHEVPRGVLKTSGFALGFQHSSRDLEIVNEWKIMFDSYSEKFIAVGCCPIDLASINVHHFLIWCVMLHQLEQ